MKKIVVRSYAKINICLDITGLKEDGYHLLDMVVLPIELHDTLLIEETPRAVDNYITLDDFSIEDSEYNTVSKALDLFNGRTTKASKYKIDVHKVIPIKAGLGGVSSNAAFTLKSVNDYKKNPLSDEELAEIAVKIGADVPFFLKAKPARCKGVGEDVTPIEVKNNYYVLIVKPEIGCSTKQVYKLSNEIHNWPHGNVDDVIKALAEGDDELLADSIFNVLEEPAIKVVPEIANIKDELKQLGLKIVLMSGSGSSVFALSTDKALIKKCTKALENRYNVIVTKVIK